MREIERIDRILDLIKQLWIEYPDLRFNQLISNLWWEYSNENNDRFKEYSYSKWEDEKGTIVFKKDMADVDLFYLEDDEFEQFLISKLK